MNSTFPATLTNGHYTVKLSSAGAGASMFDWMALNRWAGDTVEDAHGFFLYLRDVESNELWSAGLQPTQATPTNYSTTVDEQRVVIEREDHEILTTLEISVDANDPVELRRLRLQNLSRRPRSIEVTSCIEVALAHPMGDLGHPAFSKLFVQTELCGAALVAKRRPRSQGETWPALLHVLSGAPTEAWETDRLRFIGRGRSLQHPRMQLSGTVGNVLDPLFSLRTTIELQPHETREILFLLGVAQDHAKVVEFVARHAPSASLKSTMTGLKNENAHARGDFSTDGTEYRLSLPWQDDGLCLPPMPWCNVLANERFGCLVTERGAGSTWARNSQANRLTPWSNDPVSDPHDEALYIRDEANGKYWSPLPGPCPAAADYSVAHGFGYSRWKVSTHGLEQETTVFVARKDPVKLMLLRITNRHHEAKQLSLFSYHRLVLGTMPPAAGTIKTWQSGGALCAANAANAAFGDGIAFTRGVITGGILSASHASCDRSDFLGALGSTRSPQALRNEHLDESIGGQGEACFAQQWTCTLDAGQTMTVGIVLGEAVGETELASLLARYGTVVALEAALEEVRTFWHQGLSAVQAKTPVPEIDRMVNGWLGYQALACRIWGRTAFYQSSGAYGFRDQLQDAGNLTLLWPELTRKQILLHAAHQFVEGDVLHWWHEPPINRGVRTRFSDDLLWLPLITADYVRSTGDSAVLDEVIPFLKAPLLNEGEDENYLQPEPSGESASLYEHCCRAIDRSLTRGSHGLPHMGTGDWNDGMNRVGREGRGESVWLGFFLHLILDDFIPLAQQRGDARTVRYVDYQKKLHQALNDTGWDGGWYRRAYYDNGIPLGTSTADECRIDGLAQAWSVLSGVASPERAEMALKAAQRHLILQTDGLIRLLTPPFVNTPEDPGYIKGYVAGVRENGGQYTHASCWMVRAYAKLGRRDLAAKLLLRLSPAWHSRNAAQNEIYKVEPYVVAADIYGAEPHIGRGGWTWYTGSAGWAFRAAIESVLGLRVEGGHTLVIQPCVPDDWPEYSITFRPPGTEACYVITVVNPGQCSAVVVTAELDGRALPVANGVARIPLLGEGTHTVAISLGSCS
jgi:N,N'-diacetylchitobiose phosphorylase